MRGPLYIASTYNVRIGLQVEQVCWLYLQVHQVDSALQVLRDTASHLLCTQRAAALHCVELAINLATTERRKVQARLFIKTKQRILSNVTTEEKKNFSDKKAE